MELVIHAPKIGTTDSLSDHIERRMRAALGQFERRIRTVDVKVEDINANRGGIDKNCKIVVHLDHSGTIIAEDTQPDMYAAVSLAADKIKNAVGHELGRRRRH